MRIVSLLALLVVVSFTHAASAVARGPLDSTNKPDLGKNATAKKEDTAKPAFKELEGEDRTKEIARVETYLSGISSIIANFTQDSSDGSTGDGKFYMKRPGKMRWQYNPPTPILLVSNGKSITYYDAGLDQVSHIDVDDTLAGFLAQKDIKLESDSTKLTKFEQGEGVIRATMIQKKKPNEGSLTLELSNNPLEIKRLITVDATGNETRVQLENAQYGPVLEDKLFVFTDPRGVNYKRNKKR